MPARKSAKKRAKPSPWGSGRKVAKPSTWPKPKTKGGTAKKVAKKAAPKKKSTPLKKAAKKASRKPNAAFMTPLLPSPALADLIGSKALPRTEMIKKIWEYIKKNKLQDNKNKRMINADARLKMLFEGRDQVSMFDLARIVSKNVK